MSARLSSVGAASCGKWGRALGASVCQPPFSGAISMPPSHGAALDALRPAWLIWMHTGTCGARRRARCSLSASAAWVASSHRPKQPGLMRPTAETAVASMVNRPAPLLSKLVQWLRCQSVAWPFSAEYWHMGATTMRLGKVRGPLGASKVKGVKSKLMGWVLSSVEARRAIAVEDVILWKTRQMRIRCVTVGTPHESPAQWAIGLLCRSAPSGPTLAVVRRKGLACRFVRGCMSLRERMDVGP